jgi:hypothetical protein
VRANDDLNLAEITGDDDIFVLDHFGAERVGRVENIKFSDKILRGSDLPLSSPESSPFIILLLPGRLRRL